MATSCNQSPEGTCMRELTVPEAESCHASQRATWHHAGPQSEICTAQKPGPSLIVPHIARVRHHSSCPEMLSGEFEHLHRQAHLSITPSTCLAQNYSRDIRNMRKRNGKCICLRSSEGHEFEDPGLVDPPRRRKAERAA